MSALLLLIPLGLTIYVIRGSLVSRQVHAQALAEVQRLKKENKYHVRYILGMKRSLHGMEQQLLQADQDSIENRSLSGHVEHIPARPPEVPLPPMVKIVPAPPQEDQ